MPHTLPYAVNCSLLFGEVPLLERPAAAAAAGFSAVEFWWPWPDRPVPADAELDRFVAAVRDAGVQVVGLNLFAGDLASADAGVVSIPGREAELRDNVEVVVGLAEQLRIPAFNALYGVRLEGVDPRQQDELATANLTHVAERLATVGGTVLVEPLSGPKPYPLRTAADVVAVLDRVGRPEVTLLLDLFHLAGNGAAGDGDAVVDAAIDRYADRVGHVQVADHPGRHEPGTGTLDLDRHLAHVQETGYAGHVALEYVPSTSTLDSLAWLPVERRS
jgi:hydroxypyruvate isomerase